MRNAVGIAIMALLVMPVFGGDAPNPNDRAAKEKELEKKLLQRIEEEKAAIELQRQKARLNDQQARENRDGARRPDDGQRPEEGRKPDDGRQNPMPKVHAKFADGTELEIDAPLLMMPGAGQTLLDKITDPAKDGVLALKVGRDIEAEMVETLKQSIAKVCPNVNLEKFEPGGLLVIKSDSVGELRKALVLVRALQTQMRMGPQGPPPGDRPQRGPGGDQPRRERKDDPPGQF